MTTSLSGTTLAHYDVLEKLGEGGMGVVYKARDTHLDRFVALKLLPPDRVGDPERKRRFAQEAKAASALNHPNIVVIHDIASSDGHDFIAMEHVPGKTLSQLIPAHGLRMHEALRIAIQVADALGAAHAAGIVHRDLKPANVIIGDDGRARVLDFGLAKLLEPGYHSPDAPTRTLEAHTEEGRVIGTVAYMSPEQAEGRPIDARSDIFSFGALLYEMVTGRQAFSGDSKLSTLGAILHKDPAPLPEIVRPELCRVIRRCLRKDPERRYQAMKDVKVELEDLAAEVDSGVVAAAPRRISSRWHYAAWILSGLLALGWAAFAWWQTSRIPPAPTVVRFRIDIPQTGLYGTYTPLALSHDGTVLVYSAVEQGTRRLYRRPLNRLSAEPIPGTENAGSFTFSSDGKSLLFARGKALLRISLASGDAATIQESPVPAGIAESSDGRIVIGTGIAAEQGRGLLFLSGTPQQFSSVNIPAGEMFHVFPEFLPGGKGLLFTILRAGLGYGVHHLGIQRFGEKTHRVIVENGVFGSYLDSGHILFRRGASLYAVLFDAREGKVTGPAVRVVDDLIHVKQGHSFAVSRTGTLAYLPRDTVFENTVPVWVTLEGREEPIPIPSARWGWPVLSPDGKRLALCEDQEQEGSLAIWDFAREALVRRKFNGNTHAQIWSPDGAWIIFSADMDAPQANIWRARADGSGQPERLTSSLNHQDPGSFSPDGRILALAEFSAKGSWDIHFLHLDSRRTTPFLESPAEELDPVVSPDGRWIAYTSRESGRNEVYVQPFPDGGARTLISTNGGDQPLWHPQMTALYYRAPEGVMAVSLGSGKELNPARPRVLIKGDYRMRKGYGYPNYDISRDGRRFLLMKNFVPERSEPQRIHVIVNFLQELVARTRPGGG